MDSNHRCLGVGQESLPLDHGTVLIFAGGSRGTRTHKRPEAATCFRDRLLIRPDDFRCLFCPSCGSWNRTSGLLSQSQASLPTATVPQCSVKDVCHASKVRGEGFEPSSPASKTGGLPLADPRPVQIALRLVTQGMRFPRFHSSTSALRELDPPDRFGRPVPLPLGQEHVAFSRELRWQESNLRRSG
jgi:hypothetical protein